MVGLLSGRRGIGGCGVYGGAAIVRRSEARKRAACGARKSGAVVRARCACGLTGHRAACEVRGLEGGLQVLAGAVQARARG